MLLPLNMICTKHSITATLSFILMTYSRTQRCSDTKSWQSFLMAVVWDHLRSINLPWNQMTLLLKCFLQFQRLNECKNDISTYESLVKWICSTRSHCWNHVYNRTRQLMFLTLIKDKTWWAKLCWLSSGISQCSRCTLHTWTKA